METKQNAIGGATLWARQTVESEVFSDKPDKWFKIWFYLVNKVCFKEEKRYERGEIFMKYDWISMYTKATKNQIDGFMRWAKDQGMVETKQTTRGMILKIVNYGHYQTMDNYCYKPKTQNRESNERAVELADTKTEAETEEKPNKQKAKIKKEKIKTDTETEAKQKHNRSITDTILKNEKNDKNEKSNIVLRAELADPKVLSEKEMADKELKDGVAQVFDIFYKTINPNINFGNKTSRTACEFLIKKWGLEPTKRASEYAISVQTDTYAPTITTPYQLKEKMSALIRHKQKEAGKAKSKVKDIIGL